MNRKHPHRLPPPEYRGFRRYFLTVCTHGRAAHFAEPAIAADVLDQLRNHAAHFAFEVPAYCLMPDHAHMLVEGRDERADLERFVRLWKQATGFAAKQRSGIVLWQRSYYEHALRDDESTVATAAYILENPVRAGLVREPLDYPWVGSLTHDVRALLEMAQDRPT